MTDPYSKLRPPEPTPADELCRCSLPSAVILQPQYSANPITCLSCGGEVPPERLALPPDLADDLGVWTGFHNALHDLWLDSAEYEDFARKALEDFNAPVNQRGYAIAQRFNALTPCHYFIFRDTGVDNYVDASSCPRCDGPLQPKKQWQECSSCRIFV